MKIAHRLIGSGITGSVALLEEDMTRQSPRYVQLNLQRYYITERRTAESKLKTRQRPHQLNSQGEYSTLVL